MMIQGKMRDKGGKRGVSSVYLNFTRKLDDLLERKKMLFEEISKINYNIKRVNVVKISRT